MKDFVKWLGVNEKIAKVVVWLLIIMVTLIIFNSLMESMGLPYYQITYKNLKSIDTNTIIEYVTCWIMSFLDFIAIALLVFRIKKIKVILKSGLLYVVINTILSLIIPYNIMQICILVYIIVFCYKYSGNQTKYILYGLLAAFLTIVLQWIWYNSKVKLIDYSQINAATKIILSFDYYIIIAAIIIVKEIIIRKRGEKDGRTW